MSQFLVFVVHEWQLFLALAVLGMLYVWTEGRRAGATISVHQLTAQVNGGAAVILDLRDAKEYREGHITHAMNIPFAKLGERLPELQMHREGTLILVDKMGQHSGSAGRTLREAGYNVLRLQGGMSEWTASNLPVVKGR